MMADNRTGEAKGGRQVPGCLFDTNVLVSATASQRRLHQVAQRLVRGASLAEPTYVSGQILREYLVVATRPLASNGLALPPAEAVANTTAFRSLMHCLEENDEVHERLAQLVLTHECRGVAIHDANVVATALTHRVPAIVTENWGDFRRYEHLIEVVPLASVA